jgi:hypothetical protein
MAFTVISTPIITSLSPAAAKPGSAAFTLTINGTNFVQGATVQWGSTTLTTNYVSGTQLTAAVTADLVATAGTPSVTVTTIAGTSSGATFDVGPTIAGVVVTGASPIVGATVQLYAAGVSGYGEGATSVTTAPVSATTDASGSFTLGYTCPTTLHGDMVYLVATGGHLAGGQPNTGIALMTPLGACGSIGTLSAVVINEVTTVASEYALQQFMGADGVTVGASSTNYQGLVNAFGTVGNLVNIADSTDAYGVAAGAARAITPFYTGLDSRNPTGWSSTYGDPSSTCPGSTCLSANNTVPAAGLNTSTVPYQRINTLANVLASCVEASGNCSALSSLTGSSSNTLAAAHYIAQNPGKWSGTSGLHALVSTPSTPFTPPYGNAASTLSAEPNDWTLALTFTGAGLGVDPLVDPGDTLNNAAVAIDATGNVWALSAGTDVATSNWGNWANGLVAEFNAKGEALTPPTSTPNGYIYQDPNTGYLTYGGWGPNVINPVWATYGYPENQWLPGLYEQAASIAIDASQNPNLWIHVSSTGYGSVTATSPNLSLLYDDYLSGEPAPGTSLEGAFSAFDSAGHLWDVGGGNAVSGDPTTIGEAIPPANAVTKGATISVTISPSDAQPGLCSLVADTNDLLWGGGCSLPLYTGASVDDKVYIADPVAGTQLGSYSGVYGYSLAAGSAGSVYACNIHQNGYVVMNRATSTTAPASTFSPSNGRCGTALTVDGNGNVWSMGYDTSNSVYVLDAVNLNGSGSQITPDTGYTGTSSAEFTATGLTTINGVDYMTPDQGVPGHNPRGAGGIAIDGSGNLWVLNGAISDGTNASTKANALVEYVGLAAPVITPVAQAVANGQLGAKP